MLAEVRELITGVTRQGVSSSQVLGAVADDALAESGRRLIGRRVGAWSLAERIGVGGMGSVYLGERVDGAYRQQVAIKLINPAVLSDQVLKRFQAERQILADLEHPNIARLLDGGSTDDGHPYLVLEYVDGVPLDIYCDSHGLDTAALLEMFRTVCGAVHYAHGQLVVHRDLKPGNILVTSDGTPKLLDFGIAKLLGDTQTRTKLTENVRPMTPQYASPEQVRGGRITTATDVYALGVILYKLLTGRLPFEAQTSAGTSLEKLICDSDPVPPSVTVTDGRASGERDLSASRQALKGDLDNIVLMALRKEPERRYGSAEQFADDIRRHLARLPVIARPASVRYRATRFVQRHWLGMATTAVVVAVIAGLTSFYTARLSTERDVAQRNAERAERVAALLTGIFEISDPGESRGREVTAREILDTGAGRVREELAGEPDLLAEMLDTIGTVYEGLGLYETAGNHHRQALDLRRGLAQSAPLDLAESLHALGRVYFELGRYEDGVRVTGEALRIERAERPAGSVELATAINQLGFQHFHAGDVDRARALYAESVPMFEAAGAGDTEAHVTALMNLAQLEEYLGNFATSVDILTDAIASLERLKGDNYPDLATAYHNLGVSLHQLRRFDEAEAAYLRALAISRQLYDDDHPDIGATLGALGRMHHEAGDYDAAERYYRDALAHSTRVLGESHTYTAYDLGNLASLLLDRKEHAAAHEAYTRVLDIYSQSLPEDHPYIASALTAYARLLNAMSRVDEAIAAAGRAIAICDASLPADHWLAATAQTVLGHGYVLAGRAQDAEPLLPAGYERLVDARGRGDPRTQRALRWTVAMWRALGNERRAEEMLAAANVVRGD